MRTELKRLHIENGATTIYVTHDQVEAMALADRIAIMNEGVLQQVGAPVEVYRHPANLFVAQFIGSPVMNIAKATVAVDGERARLKLGDDDTIFDFPARAMPPGVVNGSRQAMLGVRPEGIMVSPQRQDGASPVEAHIIEPLGAYDIVDLKLGSQFLRARTPSGFVPKRGRPRSGPGSTRRRLHFFDSASGDSHAHCGRWLRWRTSDSRASPRPSAAIPRLRTCRLRSRTASSSCCSGRPAPARPRRCG